ncbi:histidine triad (HIT) family protein [Nakamurella panacisegetis]|uniref:Histidine triad (HIT) family protein n=1 Tax=Nakamurella panacisegetis TaxID=1090615 RepID=A0A1H0HR20_9ACTN|nr:histidine triad nucleotide-binding protein [Nakamurella panacisegetis]SDO21569.1 histidine triad (HIT) family protein [Nakamurella panacisegetis]
MTDPDCLFCRIVAGAVPATIVYSDADVVAFRDINPHAPVHVLVVPRLHYADAAALAAADPALVGAMVSGARSVAAGEGVEKSGYRLIFNTGPDAGQTVFHAHLHLLGGGPLRLTMA